MNKTIKNRLARLEKDIEKNKNKLSLTVWGVMRGKVIERFTEKEIDAILVNPWDDEIVIPIYEKYCDVEEMREFLKHRKKSSSRGNTKEAFKIRRENINQLSEIEIDRLLANHLN